MHRESDRYDSPPDRPHSAASLRPSTAKSKSRPSVPSRPDLPRRPRSAVVPPDATSFAPALDLPVSPTSSTSSSLFSFAPTLSSVSATYPAPLSWITSEPDRNVLAPAPLIQSYPVAVGEVAFSNESSGGLFGVGVRSGTSGDLADPGPNPGPGQPIPENNNNNNSNSNSNSSITPTDGTEPLNRDSPSESSAFSSRHASNNDDGRPPELTDLAPFSTVFSLSAPSSPASPSRPDHLPLPGQSLLQDLTNVRRPPYFRANVTCEDRATPRSHLVRSSDLTYYSGSHNDTPHSNNHRSSLPWTPAAMMSKIHSEADDEYVRKHYLPRGNVARASPPHGTSTVATSGSGATDSPLLAWPAFAFPGSDIIELLEQDDRPTFVVDVSHVADPETDALRVTFANIALRERSHVFDQITNVSNYLSDGPEAKCGNAIFKNWVLGLPSQESDKGKATGVPGSNQDDNESNGLKTAASKQPCVSSPLRFAGWLWASSTIRQHYRIIRGVREYGSPRTHFVTPRAQPTSRTRTGISTASNASENTENSETANKNAVPVHAADVLPLDITPGGSLAMDNARPSFDWTRIALTEDMSPHIAFARSTDWASTPLGPIENWPSDLCLMANLIMASPHPAAMYWGPEYTAIYNEAYTELAGQKHQSLMGSNFPDSWSEIWDLVKPLFESARIAGQAVLKHDHRLFIKRNGYLEETFFNWSLVPLVGSDGSVVGLYNPAFENTRRKVNERRMLLLNELGERTAKARTIPEFWQAVCGGLDSDEFEVPFALLYSAADNNVGEDGGSGTTTPSRTISNAQQVTLAGSVGVREGHRAAVPFLDLRTSDEGFAPYMRQAVAAPSLPIVLSDEDGTLPRELMAGLESERGFGDSCRLAVVIPVSNSCTASSGADSTANSITDTESRRDARPTQPLYGFIIMGMNPRRPYNNDYRLFLHLLARQLATSLASVVLFDEEVRRNQQNAHRAAQDHQELSQQLLLRTRQAMESENKFMRMAEFTPVGMFVTDNTGKITYCNDMWWEISRHPKDDFSPSTDSAAPSSPASTVPGPASAGAGSSPWATWMESVQEEDQPELMVVWNRLVNDKTAITHEFRFKRNTNMHTDGNDPIEITTWVLLRAYPEKDETGNLKGIFGCITDISQQKLAEEFQIQLRKEAVEHKRQQENFIDITSHEMRNPLSAVLQTVDEITSSITELRAAIKSGKEPDYNSVFDSILDASNTISICSNHQKRIVDDVQTLSKLDSRLLPVTPVDVQPVMVIHKTLELFQPEMIAHDIRCEFQVQPSYERLVGFSSWVKLDPSRLNQILINLLTNAIKFTEHSGERSITICIGASEGSSDPTQNDIACPVSDVSYVPSRQEEPEMANGSDWGEGQLINLHVAVSDSGLGLLDDEKNILFQQFSQSFPRTHVQYGGSGLGLYICRNLAELQGGQIGVTSERDRGSTFAFYVKCRRVSSTPSGIPPGSSDLSSLVTSHSGDGAAAPVIAYSSGDSRDGSTLCHCKTKNFSTPTGLPQLPSPPVLIETPLPTPVAEVTSAPGFSWEVPASAPAAPAAPDAPASPTDPAALAAPSVTRPTGTESRSIDKTTTTEADAMPPLDVLIVEDNLVNQRVLQRQLDKCGSRTMVANHGGEALDILRQSTYWRVSDEPGRSSSRSSSIAERGTSPRPYAPVLGVGSSSSLEISEPPAKTNISIVLMDLEMPVMDGMTCARAIRALERSGTLLRHVPIIAVTAYARQEQIESAKAAGIDDVISKPFRLTQLMPKVLELVTKYNTYPSAPNTP